MSQKVTLKGFHATELSFTNKQQQGTKIELENKMSYNVNYGTNDLCRCELTITAQDKEQPELFNLKVVAVGIFSFEHGMEKEIIHVLSYKELFPYVRAMAAQMTTAAGIPPLMLPFIDIEGQDIYRIDNNAQDNA